MDNLKEVLDNYKTFCLSVAKSKHITRRAFYATGLLGEVMELWDLFKKKHDLGKDIQEEDLKLECGDVLWYLMVLSDDCGFDICKEMEHTYLNKHLYTAWYRMDSIPESLSDLVAHSSELVWNLYNEENFNWVSRTSDLEEIHDILLEINFGISIFLKDNGFDLKEIIKTNTEKLKKKWGIQDGTS